MRADNPAYTEQCEAPHRATVRPILLLLLLLLFLCPRLGASQEVPWHESDFKVRATQGEAPYFPAVGIQPFTYSVAYYCDRCTITVGGITMSGSIKGDPPNQSCVAELPLQAGPQTLVVSEPNGGLRIVDARTGATLVFFGSSGLRAPPDQTSYSFQFYLEVCQAGNVPPAF